MTSEASWRCDWRRSRADFSAGHGGTPSLRRSLCAAAACSAMALGGCQAHLPALETSAKSFDLIRPLKISNLECHITRELSDIVNSQGDHSPRLKERISRDPNLAGLIKNLSKYNFVATISLTLDVTDVESFSPSLSLLTNYSNMQTYTSAVGFQLNGTQERNDTESYVVDLASLYQQPDPLGLKPFTPIECPDDHSSSSGPNTEDGLQGDLGLADVVADGLLSLQQTAQYNLYAGGGPSAPVIAQNIVSTGDSLAKTMPSIQGTLVFSPASPNTIGAAPVVFTGVYTAVDPAGGGKAVYNLSLSGSDVFPPLGPKEFSLTGAGVYNSFESTWVPPAATLGLAPTFNLTGKIDPDYDAGSLQLKGFVTGSDATKADTVTFPAAGTTVDRGPVAHAPKALNAPAFAPYAAAFAAAGASGKGASSTAASATGGSTGSSFGSLISFLIVKGANGGPNWSLTKFKAGGGTNQMFNAMRTRTDSLTISFVPSCQKLDPSKKPAAVGTPKDFWSSIAVCDDAGAAWAQSQAVGFQNNTQIILKNLTPH